MTSLSCTFRAALLGFVFLACSSSPTESRNVGGNGKAGGAGSAAADGKGGAGSNSAGANHAGSKADAGSNGDGMGGTNASGSGGGSGSHSGGLDNAGQAGAAGSSTGRGGNKVDGGPSPGAGGSSPDPGNRGGSNAGGSAPDGGGKSGASNRGGSNAGGSTGTGGAPADTGLPSKCSGMCNAATPADVKMTAYGALGNVTVYTTSASSGGACNYGKTNVMSFAAIETGVEWDGGKICGQCLEVTLLTSQGLKTTVVRVMDKCPDANCGVDLGGSSSDVVMADKAGRYEGAWRKVPCTGQSVPVSDGSPSLYVKDGASRGWSIVQVRNPNAAVTSIDYVDANAPLFYGKLDWSTDAENFLSVPTDILQYESDYLFTIHYSDGSTGTVTLSSTQLATPSKSYPLD